jgi:hypothetical protein
MLLRAFRNALPPREISSQGTFNGIALRGRRNGAVLVHVERRDSPPPQKGDNGKYDGHGDGTEKDHEDEESDDDKKDKGAKKFKPSKGYLT